MITSAALLAIAGISLTFLPSEILNYFQLPEPNSIVLQILGALYFGFAMLNWTAKANLIGGIYSKPVSIANFTHFLIGALALAKIVFNNNGSTVLWIAEVLYVSYALLFGYITFLSPAPKSKSFNNK